jgi:hypothetical protein
MKITTDINNKIIEITNSDFTLDYNTSYFLDENPFENWSSEKILSYCYFLEYVLIHNGIYVPIEKIYPAS